MCVSYLYLDLSVRCAVLDTSMYGDSGLRELLRHMNCGNSELNCTRSAAERPPQKVLIAVEEPSCWPASRPKAYEKHEKRRESARAKEYAVEIKVINRINATKKTKMTRSTIGLKSHWT